MRNVAVSLAAVASVVTSAVAFVLAFVLALMPAEASSAEIQTYIPVEGGFEITNGAAVASRPLYGGHAIDNGRKPVKSVMYAGDDGAVMLSGIFMKGSKPNDGILRFSAPGAIVARYCWGHEEYLWPQAKVTLVREVLGDGLVAKVEGEVLWKFDGAWTELSRSGEYVFFARKGSRTDEQLAPDFAANAKRRFENALEEMRRVASRVRVKTPDALVDAAVAAQCVAADALWEDPCICHGAIGWHNGQGGWRGPYSVVTLFQPERLKSNWRLYASAQLPDGRLRNYPWGDRRYNMAEVLVDSLMLYWKASGDRDFFQNEAYDVIRKHLEYESATFGVEGTHLYENWLNAWNTDNKWCNGGAGTIASAYNYRAYATMAEIAAALGKSDDAAAFAYRAAAIRKDAKRLLWDEGKGVFGEYRDRFGRKRLQNCPDTSSVYTPIDCALATREEALRMLDWVEREIPCRVTMDGRSFLYSSNKLPLFYSSCGLYCQETLNVALAYWQCEGGNDKAFRHFRSCLEPMIYGVSAGPGTACLELGPDLTNRSHVDFGDVVAQVTRTAVEGLFGIAFDVPNGRVTLTPGFPSDWNAAEIETPLFGYRWTRKRGVEVTKNPRNLAVAVRDGSLRAGGSRRSSSARDEVKTDFGNPKGEGTDCTVPEGCSLVKVDLAPYANQNLRLLHAREWTPRIGNFPFVKDTTRTVCANGRSWWEAAKGARGKGKSAVRGGYNVPDMPDRQVVCASLYDQVPDAVAIPVHRRARKALFLVSLSTNPNQSWTENARVSVRFADGTQKSLSLVPPDNCDDWLNYHQAKPYALKGEQTMLAERAHANRLAIDFGEEKDVESFTVECIANEVIVALVVLELAVGA